MLNAQRSSPWHNPPEWARLLILFGVVLLLGVSPAQAGPNAPDDGCLNDTVCRNHYGQGVKLFEVGRFEAALPEFQAAYERRQMPWLLINLGRTLHRLGRAREALDYYQRFKQAESKPDAETLDRVEKYIAQAQALASTPPPTEGGATPPNPPTAGTEPPQDPTKLPGGEPAKESPPTPLYKKWWLWTAVGGGVLAVVVIGVAAGVASRNSGLPDGVTKLTFTF